MNGQEPVQCLLPLHQQLKYSCIVLAVPPGPAQTQLLFLPAKYLNMSLNTNYIRRFTKKI